MSFIQNISKFRPLSTSNSGFTRKMPKSRSKDGKMTRQDEVKTGSSSECYFVCRLESHRIYTKYFLSSEHHQILTRPLVPAVFNENSIFLDPEYKVSDNKISNKI